jgi:hypothetical protein
MTVARGLACVAAVLAATVRADADERGIHLPSGRSVSFTWYLNDGAGYRWDISSNGQVSNGTNDAYDGGMQLRLAGTYFSSSTQGRLSADGREVEIGPWKHNNLQVWRRIYVDPKLGYCRWIDIFENTTDAVQDAKVQYYSNLGLSVTSTYTTSGQANLTDKDWGIVTSGTGSTSRPAVIHVFANRGSRIKPSFRYTRNSDSVYQDVTVKVPAGKAVALCIFHAQRRPDNQARQFLDQFKPRRELGKVPPALRRILLNMGGATLTLGNIDLPRHEKHDLAVLRNENELLGKILNERFDVETFYGKLELPAGRVLGLSVPAPDDPHVQVVLVDGQIVAGKLLNAPLRIRLTNGNEMALPPARLASATFAISPQRPDEIKISRPTVILRSGQQLAFRKADLDCTFQSLYGTVKLDADDLHGIHFDTPEGGLHRAVFRNGSVLSGLLVADELRLKLDLGPQLAIRRHLASQVAFPSEDIDGADLAELALRNEDQLFGRIVEESLTVTTRYGNVTVKPAEISELQIPEAGALGQVRIKLHNGTTVTGKFVGETIGFQIVPGPKLPVFLGHVLQIVRPGPATSGASTRPAAEPVPAEPGGPELAPPPEPPAVAPADVAATGVTAPPAAAPAETAAEATARVLAEKLAKLKTLAAELAQLQEARKKLDLQAKALAEKGGDVRALAKVKKGLASTDARMEAVRKEIAVLQKSLPRRSPAARKRS